MAQMAIAEDEQNSLKVGEKIQQWITTRKETIEILRENAEEADQTHQGCCLSNRNASLTSAFGGAFGMLTATFASWGLAAPFVIGSIATACSLGGGAWSIKNEYERGKRNSATQEKIMQQLEKDVEAQNQMNDILKSIENGDFGGTSRVLRQLQNFVGGVQYQLVSEDVNEAAKKAAKEAARRAAKKAAKEAAKKAGTAAAKKSARKAARDVVSKVAQQQAKIAARTTGMMTIGFGALSSLGEGYNAYSNHYASQEGSELGNELRSLADKLQNA